jgi:predicted nucleic acid-binding protein
MGRVALDSSVLIALLNDNDAHHKLVHERLSESDDQFEISAVTLMESLVGPFMENARSATEIRKRISLAVGSIEPVTEEVAVQAAKIRAATALKAPDSIISASATLSGATLWTLDQRLAKAHKGAILVA